MERLPAIVPAPTATPRTLVTGHLAMMTLLSLGIYFLPLSISYTVLLIMQL